MADPPDSAHTEENMDHDDNVKNIWSIQLTYIALQGPFNHLQLPLGHTDDTILKSIMMCDLGCLLDDGGGEGDSLHCFFLLPQNR